METMQSTEVQMRSTMPENYAKILYHCKCVTILDLVMKFAFAFCFPKMETLIFGLVSSIPSAIALYGICLEKEPINKSKWLLPALIHHAFIYILFLGIALACHLHFLFSGKFRGYYELPLDPIRQLLVIVLLSGTGLAIALFAFVQMSRMFLYKWSDLIKVVKEADDKSKEEKMMV